MQSLLKLIPVACIAIVVGTVAGYSLHGPATRTVKACIVPETIVQKSAMQVTEAGRTTASVESEGSSWARWPSVTDF
jgi:hypothetical protein